jgi:DNA gyrase subunit A
MRFREGDELLAMEVVRPGATVFTVTDRGFAKRTPVEDYRLQNRGGLGVQVMRFAQARGSLVGALVVDDNDEVFSIKLSGDVTRVSVAEVNSTGRVTMGVTFTSLAADDAVVAIARNAERAAESDVEGGTGDQEAPGDEGEAQVATPEPAGEEVTGE